MHFAGIGFCQLWFSNSGAGREAGIATILIKRMTPLEALESLKVWTVQDVLGSVRAL